LGEKITLDKVKNGQESLRVIAPAKDSAARDFLNMSLFFVFLNTELNDTISRPSVANDSCCCSEYELDKQKIEKIKIIRL